MIIKSAVDFCSSCFVCFSYFGNNKCGTLDFIEIAFQFFDMIRHSPKVNSRLDPLLSTGA